MAEPGLEPKSSEDQQNSITLCTGANQAAAGSCPWFSALVPEAGLTHHFWYFLLIIQGLLVRSCRWSGWRLLKAVFNRRAHAPPCRMEREYLGQSKTSMNFRLLLRGQTEFSITVHFLVQYLNSLQIMLLGRAALNTRVERNFRNEVKASS